MHHSRVDCNLETSLGLFAQNPFRMEMMEEMKRSMSHMVTENSTAKRAAISGRAYSWLVVKVVEIYYKYRYLLISE